MVWPARCLGPFVTALASVVIPMQLFFIQSHLTVHETTVPAATGEYTHEWKSAPS